MGNSRVTVIFILFSVGFVVLIVRLFYWQIVRGQELSSQAKYQYQLSTVVTAPRGEIFSRDNSLLAGRLDSWLVFVSKPQIKITTKELANKIAPFLVDNKDNKTELLDQISEIEKAITKKDVSWIPLKHRVLNDEKKQIEDLEISGIGFDEEEIRGYPEASLAAQLLGFVGKDEDGRDKGYFGLEGFYDLTLTGKAGIISQEKDAKGVPIFWGDKREVKPIGGVDLLTNIDKSIQFVAEKKLLEGIEKYGAKGGSVVVMNPKTGGIEAMASSPSYDPRSYWEYSNEVFKNPIISDTFEPGSIFKVLVMAAGIDDKVISPDTVCTICSGPLKVDKYSIETWNNKYYPESTMLDVIIHSDNVGMAFVGQKVGADTLYDYLSKFGIGKLSGIDLQGEVSVKLRDRGIWNIVDLATASFGQGVAVTGIQMVRAVGAIANKGILVTPEVVKSLRGDGWVQDVDIKQGERVVSVETAQKVTQMMTEAAVKGESKWARVPGFSVAAKTGTAQIPVAGHYDAKKTNASFIGFAPSNNPRFVMLVTLNEPTTSPWASETAAPTWYSIARELFQYYGIQPTGD